MCLLSEDGLVYANWFFEFWPHWNGIRVLDGYPKALLKNALGLRIDERIKS